MPVYQDLALRVSRDGAVLDSINILDVLYTQGLAWLIPKYGQHHNEDPTHVNDIEPLSDSLAAEYPDFEAGDLLISMRHLHLVLVLDPESRRVRWYTHEPFIKPHDPDFLGDGWIGVFDNRSEATPRGTMLGGSRIVAIRPPTDSLKVLFPTVRSEAFYTEHRGKWELLPDGRMLLTEEGAGRVVEVDREGRTVWEWIVDPVRDDQVPSVTKGTRVLLSDEDVAAWSCGEGGAK